MTGQERALVAAALRWAMSAGWRRRHPRVFTSADGTVELYLQQGCVCVARLDATRTFVTPSSPMEAVTVLAALQVLPARFSTLGRTALMDHSVALMRFAAHLRNHIGEARTVEEQHHWLGRIGGVVDAAEAAIERAGHVEAVLADADTIAVRAAL